MVIFIALGFAAICIGAGWYLERRRSRAIASSPIVKQKSYQLQFHKLIAPAGIYFSPTHSWAHLTTAGRARVGVDAFIQGLTGILSAVTVQNDESEIRQGDPLFQLELEDRNLSISAPISGRVVATNTEALQNMRQVHNNPYKAGWLVEIVPSDWENETQRLYLGKKTVNWLKAEMTRVRDFFAHSFSSPDEKLGAVLLQEGGDIAEGALAFADKDLWASFQDQILDPANVDLIE